jgi:hypothetical protein
VVYFKYLYIHILFLNVFVLIYIFLGKRRIYIPGELIIHYFSTKIEIMGNLLEN